MIRNSYYNQLIESEPMGFIDPLKDLGEFDFVQMKFKHPVRQLVNKYSGKPYTLQWQRKIEEMRILYIRYQESLKAEDEREAVQKRLRSSQSKAQAKEVIATYLQLGFRFREIERRVNLSYKTLRRNYSRTQYIRATSPEFYLKRDLQDGLVFPMNTLPESMKIN